MNNEFTNLPQNSLDYKELIKPYLKHWKWFFVCMSIAVLLGFLKIRYSIPEYAIQAKIQILEDQNSTSELDVFRDLSMFSGGGSNVEDEIEILKSRTNLVEIVKQLGLNKRVIAVGKIKNTELYDNPPFNVNFIAPDSIVHNSKDFFFINLISDTSFEFSNEEDGPVKVYSYGKTISSTVGDIVITPNDLGVKKTYDKIKYQVVVTPLAVVAQSYQKRINITMTDKLSNIISISLNDAVKSRAKDVINTLINNYNRNDIDDKKAIADKTSTFINERINDIYTSLSTVDQTAEDFKSGRGLTDIASQSNINLNLGAANQQELQNSTIQLKIATSMRDIVDNQEGFEVLPSNIGLADASIAGTTARYNELVLQRKRLLKSSNEKNPIIVNLNQQLEGLKRNMQSSLNSMTSNLSLQVNSLSSQLSIINSKIYSAPKNERALRDITRQQQTTESLYLYLLQKREESQITFASSSPKSKIIDEAYLASNFPVSPKRTIILLASLILGFLVPFSLVYVNDLLDNKVHNKVGLEKIVGGIPVLAELPKLSRKEDKLVKNNDRSVLAESLRILRTNLDYIIKSKKTTNTNNNLIFITSSVSGEGKTFLSSNLAMIFANTNKKVLLIGADIRNPKLYTFFSKNKEVDKIGKSRRGKNVGLTEYLFDDSLSMDEIINPMLVRDNTIDVIFSGKIPPNPTELLMNDRIKQLFNKVSLEYDYVIVDTAPLMVVTDTLLISEYADQILYVTKAGVTENKVLEFPLKLKKEGKLKNLSFIVNNVNASNLGYGGKYGYGYNKSIKKWWKF